MEEEIKIRKTMRKKFNISMKNSFLAAIYTFSYMKEKNFLLILRAYLSE
jgi:hypothetical protein